MSRERTTPPPRAPDATAAAPTTDAGGTGTTTFVHQLAADDNGGGGKARSLARLAALGLPVPPVRVIDAALFRALRAGGPSLPPGLASAADLARLDAARAALVDAPLPAGFDDQLRATLAELHEAARDLPPTDGLAVRSSGASEDRAGGLAAGVFTSRLRVPATQVGTAIREVLASYLAPAAWVYATRGRTVNSETAAGASGTAVDAPDGGVLIHPFVVGTSFGVCACGDGLDVHILPDAGAAAPPTAGAAAQLRAAAHRAAAAHGPSELEWVSDGDRVLFLQLRGYRPSPTASRPARDAAVVGMGPDWVWDAAHNPSPLTPAQAGLVELVDDRCRIGIRQRVVGGYLYFRPSPESAAPAATVGETAGPRAAFDRVRAETEQRLAALGPAPSLAAALATYVAGYQGVFGSVGPILSRARRELAEFLTVHAADGPALTARLLAGVVSIATERREAAHAIARAPTTAAKEAAINAYLQRFGDESGRWDVAEPTLRETPARLVLLGAGGNPPAVAATENAPLAAAAAVRDALPTAERSRFAAVLDAARSAVAVGEDDDALFSRLQAAVRHALLRQGEALVSAGTLEDVSDVFFLPLAVAPAAAAGDQDLPSIAAANRRTWEAASRSPPTMPTGRATEGVVRGQPGSGGRAVGRAVHHPASTPLGPDDVLIAATLLPTELPLLSPGALVVETGGILGHVAAQARERSLPAVVGAPGALTTIPEGALVLVDGDRGEVLLLG